MLGLRKGKTGRSKDMWKSIRLVDTDPEGHGHEGLRRGRSFRRGHLGERRKYEVRLRVQQKGRDSFNNLLETIR